MNDGIGTLTIFYWEQHKASNGNIHHKRIVIETHRSIMRDLAVGVSETVRRMNPGRQLHCQFQLHWVEL